MPTICLDDRSLIEVRGAEAVPFLQNLITTDLNDLEKGELRPGALLTPQGKILFDLLVSRSKDGLNIDCRRDIADEFVKRLALYKLRAKVDLEKKDQTLVAVSWQNDSSDPAWLKDLRFHGMDVYRFYDARAGECTTNRVEWDELRVDHGVGESGMDFELGEAFPHDILLDFNGGVSFKKGCFVGQEVVSRMQHRGTARRRLVKAVANSELSETDMKVVAGERVIGSLGTVCGRRALAMVRTDRAGSAVAQSIPISAGGVALELSAPDWADFELSEGGRSDA